MHPGKHRIAKTCYLDMIICEPSQNLIMGIKPSFILVSLLQGKIPTKDQEKTIKTLQKKWRDRTKQTRNKTEKVIPTELGDDSSVGHMIQHEEKETWKSVVKKYRQNLKQHQSLQSL